MPPTDPRVVFISHIREEAPVAVVLQKMIRNAFLGFVKPFVSSDGESIQAGQKWLSSVESALTEAVIEIVLCSPQSIQKPWINFEAGAGWIRKIPVIPVCHLGLEVSQLPIPLALLQGVAATDTEGLEQLVATIARVVGLDVPKVNFSTVVKQVRKAEGACHTAPKVSEESDEWLASTLGALGYTPEKPPLEIDFGSALAPLFDDFNDGELLDKLAILREELYKTEGIRLPLIDISEEPGLSGTAYVLKIRGAEVLRGELYGRFALLKPDAEGVATIIETTEPGFDVPVAWLPKTKANALSSAGRPVITASEVFTRNLAKVLKDERARYSTGDDAEWSPSRDRVKLVFGPVKLEGVAAAAGGFPVKRARTAARSPASGGGGGRAGGIKRN